MPKHVVIDGSNLATEGRSMPSLKQLVEAVKAFMEEHPKTLVTVVVDATFGHRIDPREVAEFDAAIDHNELVAPPAGAVGRGDAFVLAIANKVNATIVSNDSYQEFHGEYPWLFDEGRLIGGKPVPHVGWVFVPRVPVRGPLSRRSQREAKQKLTSARPSKAASQPTPVPDAPPPGAVLPPPKAQKRAAASSAADAAKVGTARAKASAGKSAPADGRVKQTAATAKPQPAAKTDVPTPSKSAMINDLLGFLAFVEKHPVGSPVTAVVESYSSHGAYVIIGDARGYVPLRNMADPPPRSAREAMKIGETVDLVVVGFHAARRGIDLAVPALAPAITGAPVLEAVPAAPVKRSRKKAAAVPVEPTPVEPVPASETPVAAAAEPAVPSRKRAAKKATTAPAVADEAAPAPEPEPVAATGSRRKRSGAAKAAAATPATPEPVAAPEAPAAPPARARGSKKAAAPVARVEPSAEPSQAPAPAPAGKAPAKRSRTAKAPAALTPSVAEPAATALAPSTPDRAPATKASTRAKRAEKATSTRAAERLDGAAATPATGTAKKTPRKRPAASAS